jgi:hypothetical protein
MVVTLSLIIKVGGFGAAGGYYQWQSYRRLSVRYVYLYWRESPINYAPRRRHRAKLKKETKWRKRLGIGKEKGPELEDGIKNLED